MTGASQAPGDDPLNAGQSGRALLTFLGGMRPAHFTLWRVLLAVTLCVLPGTALAQTAVGANGIKVGEGRVHPFFELQAGYDSAAGFFPRGGVLTGNLEPEVLFHLRPGLRFELPSVSLSVDASGNLDYVYYAGLLTPFSQAASRLQGAADINVEVNRKGTVGVVIGDQLSRSDRTHNVALGVGVVSLFNETRLSVPIRPGGGALEITPRAVLTLEFFDPISNLPVPGCSGADPTCNPATVRTMNYLNIRPGVEGRWKFLPKTALVADLSFDLRSYLASGANLPATLIKGSVGIAGLLSQRISVVAKLGWGYDFAGSGANTLLAHLEGTYILNEVTRLKAGYLRNLDPVPVFGTFGDDRFYADARMMLNGRLNLHASAAFDYVSFYAQSGRNDIIFSLDLGPEYQVMPWLSVAGGYILGSHYSNATTAVTTNYTRNEVYLRVTFQY